MIANYHTHTPRCHHASGTEREYARCGLESGLKILGFSDHTPYPFDGGYVSSIRMGMDELPDYVRAVTEVKEEYEGRMEIRLGVEAEFYPKYFDRLVRELRGHGVEYMLLGQHMLGNEIGEWYNGQPTTDAGKLDRYVGQVMEAMDTGLFTYLAHPDLAHFLGAEKEFERQMRRLCIHARECGLPVELNLLGYREGRHYPNPFFWRIAAEEGVTAVLGADAHTPGDLLVPHAEAEVLAKARSLGLTVAETVPLRIL